MNPSNIVVPFFIRVFFNSKYNKRLFLQHILIKRRLVDSKRYRNPRRFKTRNIVTICFVLIIYYWMASSYLICFKHKHTLKIIIRKDIVLFFSDHIFCACSKIFFGFVIQRTTQTSKTRNLKIKLSEKCEVSLRNSENASF